MQRKQRFDLFLERLAAAPAASTHVAAFDMIRRTLNEVEDAHSGVRYNPSNHLNDGRLYPPRSDSARHVPGRSDLVRYRARRHNVWIAANGAVRIDEVPSAGRKPITCLSKAGADGKKVKLEND